LLGIQVRPEVTWFAGDAGVNMEPRRRSRVHLP
jgi:hypothetical protein